MDEAMHKAIQVRAYFLWLEADAPPCDPPGEP